MCALIVGRRVAGWPVRADGEDRIWCDRGADRLLVPARGRDIEHIGSAHGDAELEVLKAAARYRLTAGQAELDLGLDFAAAMPAGGRGRPLPITRRGWGIWWMS
jgi:hypothetical protein